MPKVTYDAIKGLVQKSGSGIELEGDIALTGALTATGALSVTGAATLSAALIGSVDTRSEAGVVSLTKLTTFVAVTGGADRAISLAAGTDGQIKIIIMRSKGGAGNAVLTPANGLLGGNTTITFDAAGDAVVLVYSATDAKWAVASNNGATIA